MNRRRNIVIVLLLLLFVFGVRTFAFDRVIEEPLGTNNENTKQEETVEDNTTNEQDDVVLDVEQNLGLGQVVQDQDDVEVAIVPLEYTLTQTVLEDNTVLVIVKANKPLSSVPGFTYHPETDDWRAIFDENGTFPVVITDEDGQTEQRVVVVIGVDDVAPEVEVTYSTEELTNKDVLVTLTVNEDVLDIDGWTRVDDRTFAKVYELNGSETVEVSDVFNNTTTIDVEVTNIDKVLPTVELLDVAEFNPETFNVVANDNILLKRIDFSIWTNNNSDKVAVWGMNLNTDNLDEVLDYFRNGSVVTPLVDLADGKYTLRATVADLAGNVVNATSVEFEVDRTKPVLNTPIKYEDNTIAEDSVINSNNKIIVDIDEINLRRVYVELMYKDSNGIWRKKYGQEFHENAFLFDINVEEFTNEELQVKFSIDDLAGNHAGYSYRFTVDKIAPEITIKESSIGSENVYSNISFKLYDNVGVKYFLLNGKKYTRSVNKWSEANFQNIKGDLVQGENTIELFDVAGNSTSLVFEYDSVTPVVELNYSETLPTKEDVLVTLTVNEDVLDIDGWTKVNSRTFTKSYNDNLEEDVIVTDLAGNAVVVTVDVKNIDKAKPFVEVISPNNLDLLNLESLKVNVKSSDDLSLRIITASLYKADGTRLLTLSKNNLNTELAEVEIDFSSVNYESGMYYFKVNAKDYVENTSNTVTINFELDNTNPIVKVNLNREKHINSGDHINVNKTPEYETYDDNLSQIIISKEDGTVVNTILVDNVTSRRGRMTHLSTGVYNIVAIDKVGNESEPFVVVIDNDRPEVEVLDFTNDFDFKDGKVTFKVKANDNFELNQVIVNLSKNGTMINNLSQYVSGNEVILDYDLSNLNLETGNYSFKVSAYDKAGNYAPILSKSFEINK